ncbi:MAG: hypothetical protein KBF06_09635, partial [Bacteroidales bacterium]|nr:hypothetical protein [Bacteroidales bacterium]MBP9512731.1 hypothetical protein [Bacteroidales bacterium]MBP9589352.1 hypothetical protein [Bacteroidales bacterium]
TDSQTHFAFFLQTYQKFWDTQNYKINIDYQYIISVSRKSAEKQEKVCELLNDTETIFPGTNMTLAFKTATT